MKANCLVFTLLLLCLDGLSFAAVPPEMPQLRASQIFSPFYFEIGDNGEDVVRYGGPKLQGYSVSPFIQTSMPTEFRPTVNFDTFMNLVRNPSGVLFIAGHGWSDKLCVEAYSYTDQGHEAAGVARETYKSNFGIAAEDMTQITRIDLGTTWGVCVTPKFIQNQMAQFASHSVVYNAGCHSSDFWGSISDLNFHRVIVGFNDEIQVYTGGLFNTQSDGGKVADIVFNSMAGVKPINDRYQNFPISATLPMAQLVVPQTTLLRNSLQPNAGNMRLYNAPRMIEASVAQDQNIDGSFEKTLYSYAIGGGIYPYNPGNNTDYPSGGVKSSDIGSKGPIKVVLRFSEAMAINSANYYLKLIHINADGSDGPQITFDNTAWSVANAPGATLTGTANIPADFPDGTARLAVKASRLTVPPGLDTTNQELDIDGDGYSAIPAEDRSVDFTIDTAGPAIDLGGLLVGWTESEKTVYTIEKDLPLRISDQAAGIKSVAIIGPGGAELGNASYSQPYPEEFSKDLSNLATGAYTITAISGLDKTLRIYLNVGDLKADFLPENSGALYDLTADSYTARVAAHVSASFGIKNLEYVVDGVTVPLDPLKPDLLLYSRSGFKAWRFQPPADWENQSRSYVLRAQDYTGNGISIEYHLGYGLHYVLDLANGASSTPIYDTLSVAGGSMLHGAVLPVKTDSGFTLLEQNVSRYLTAVYGSGTGEDSRPVPPLADPLFEMEFKVKTGNQPDLSDGQDLALVKRTYFTVRHDSGPIPQYCLAEGENAIAICYRDAVGDNVVLELKRYYKAYTTTTSAAQAMVCSRRSELDSNRCEAWTEFTPSPSILYEIHGISLSEGTALGNTWNSVQVPAGENVSVTLGGRINVTFPAVTQEGRLNLIFTSGGAPYAHTNLQGGAVVLTPDRSLQYAGPVQVRAAYGDLGLTPSQEDSLGVFYPTGAGVYALQDAALDPVNKTLSWSSSALPPFILAAQVYPAAYEQQVEDLTFISGEPDVSARKIAPGSEEFAALSAALAIQKSKTAVSGLHFISPEGKTFSPAALVSFEVNRDDAENFDIFEFNGDLSIFIKHPKQKISSSSGTRYIAPVSMLHSYFAVLSDTEPPAGLLPDTAAPVVALSVTPEGALEEDGMEISTSTLISLSATDPDLPGYTTSGVATVYYLLNVDPDTCGEFGPVDPQAPHGTCQNYLYSGQFSLPVGAHTVYFNAVDNAGNMGEGNAVNFRVVATGAALAISPSSGPIGVPFTIKGTGFGTYSAGTTVVLIGGTTAPLTLWSDTEIQGTIPGVLAAGQYPVAVKRGAEVLAEVSPFSVTQPALYALTPSSGAIGLPFAITGESFGNYVAGFTRVLLGGATMPLTLWTDTRIQGTIPGTLPAGDYELLVERALNGGVVRTSAAAFGLRKMEAYWLAPSTGPIGMPFTITGVGFGNYSAAYTHVLIGDATAPLTLWADNKIQGTVPGSLVSGQYPVLVERRTADGGVMQTLPMTFEVVNVSVASMTPVAGPIGLPFAIYGTGFGNFSAGYTKVLIGGTTCPLTLWTDTQIKGSIPGSLATGEHPVVVERTLSGGQVQSVPVAFSVTVPEAYGLSPSSGPIGLPFTIMGANFGNYVANYTKVLIGGVAAPLTLWTDTQIKGSIPGSLADGDHEVIVERALNGGVARTSTFTFTAGTPYLDTISPSTAAVVAPFTITGYNFGNYVANYTKVLINGATTTLSLWTDTKIQGKLPFLLAGTYPVQVQRSLNGGLTESATAYINVEEPAISSMTPASGAVGSVFNLYGAGFGPYDPTITKVFVGGVQCALSLWTDTRITGTVPSALSYGTHTVVAARGLALANTLEFYIPGGYSPSMLRPGTGPSALEFKLGEVYVYPDPAKGGKVPTFHVEVGTADSVKLKVYTVAGQLAHEATLTGSPQAVGSVYAYEYAWTGRIASGVYYYTIEAERSGKKLRSKGRFSVLR